jgi:NodT family efflux transporter outer membrane factor (OMF) lipoprotein
MNEPMPGKRASGHRSAARCLILAGTALSFFGCAAGPDYVQPRAPTESRYTRTDPQRIPTEGNSEIQTMRTDLPVPARWWESFGSPELNGIVELSLTASPTLKSAQAVVDQAAGLLRAARGAAYPLLNITATGERASDSSGARAQSGRQFTIGPALSFAPDLFGGTRRRIEQADAQFSFQQAQWKAARLNLTGNTVLQAITLATAVEQVAAVMDIIAVDERNVELVNVSMTAGKSALLDVLTAESQLAADQALLPPLQQQASTARHALAVLAGRTSADWSPPEFNLAMLKLPQDLPLTIPSKLVSGRPDLLGANAQLHAANAAIGVASAQLYPNIALSASWLSSADAAGALFGSGTSFWSMAASMVAPVFNGHALAAQRDAAIAAYAAQLANYAQAVLQAFGQVADVLQALEHDAALLSAQRKAFDTARATLDLTQQSYQAGQASLLQMLESQRLYQQARLGLARARGQRYTDTAQLFIAMGGAQPEPEAHSGSLPAPVARKARTAAND